MTPAPKDLVVEHSPAPAGKPAPPAPGGAGLSPGSAHVSARVGGSGHGSCWCHGQRGLSVPADGPEGLCRACAHRSPSACQRAHEQEVAA
jgi:hypothetical protein